MTATAKKSKATPKAGKNKQKSVAAPVRKTARAKKAARVEVVRLAEPLREVASVANDEAMVQTLDARDVAPVVAASASAIPAVGDDRILLPARMELASLDEAHQLLQGRYPPLSDKCILDGGLLSVIDSAGIQMLVSFIRSTMARGCKVEWDNYSVQVYQLASELGVASQLGD